MFSIRTSCCRLALLALTTCASNEARLPGLEAIPRLSVTSGKAVSRRVVLVGDTQFQELHAQGVDVRTALTDRFARTAIRPAQLDMFSESLLLEACRNGRRNDPDAPVIHLGDAANASCQSELEQLFGALDQEVRANGWLMAPGNHDGFFLGTSDRPSDAGQWALACSTGQANNSPLTKDRFVELYVEQLRRAHGLDRTAKPAGDDAKKPLCADAPGPLLKRVCWQVSRREERWQSFVLQLIDLSVDPARRVLGVIVDTSAYPIYPKLLPSERDAGRAGALVSAQRDLIEGWLQAEPQTDFVFFGHHPLNQLDPTSRGFLLEQRQMVLYVSAHTHSGRYFLHSEPQPFVELNLGSITDYPNEYRDLALWEGGNGLVLDSWLNPNRVRLTCPREWLIDPAEIVAYRELRSFSRNAMQVRLLEAQARTWLHFIAEVGFLDGAAQAALKQQLTAALDQNSEARQESLRRATQRADELERQERAHAERNDTVVRNRLAQRDAFMRCAALRAARTENCGLYSGTRFEACGNLGARRSPYDPFVVRHDIVPLLPRKPQ
ncbi:MAG: metallophosphoesterase [Polyangiaceae bacterium]